MAVIFHEKVYNRKLTLKKLVPLLGQSGIIELAPDGLFSSFGPCTFGRKQKIETVRVPPLQLFKFKSALVNALSNCIGVENKLVFESYNDNEQFNQGFVEWNDSKYAVVKRFPEQRIDSGLFLAGLGCFNWYHWLIEILPKAMFLDKIPTKNILVSEFVAKYPSMLESLELLIGKGYNIIYLTSNVNYRVSELYHINAINYVPFELGEGINLRVKDVFMRGDILLNMRKKMISDRKKEAQTLTPLKIFLERSRHRVAVNQGELFELLSKLGFVSNNMESQTLEEQIELYHKAECIVGTSGAAFTNMIFSSAKTKFVCFLPERLSEFACFSNLANIFGLKLTYVFYELDEGASHSSNEFRIDIDKAIMSVKTALN